MIEKTYRIPGAPKLALLGDFHDGDPGPILAAVERKRPDVICIPGDIVNSQLPEGDSILESQINVLRFLRGCAGIAPTFFSYGNHEFFLPDGDVETIRALGVTILDNEWRAFRGIHIGGVTSHYVLKRRAFAAEHPSGERFSRSQYYSAWRDAGRLNLEWLSPVPEGFTILLCHHPEYFPLLPPVNLVLSGHAHGGQWRFFNHGCYAPGQGVWPRWTRGVYEGHMVVTAGLTNNTRIPRLNNPTEIVYVQG